MKPLWKVINTYTYTYTNTCTCTYTCTCTCTCTYTLHFTLYTLHFTLYTLHITHYTLHITHLHYAYTHTYTNTRACTCAFACARVRGRGGRGGEWCWVGQWVGEYVLVRVCCVVLVFVSVVLVFVSLCLLYVLIPQDCWKWIGSSGKANDWRTRERVVLDLFSDLEWVRTKGFFGEPLGSRDNLTWANFGKQNWRWPALPSPLPPPCVHSKRPLVYVRNVSVCTGTTRICVITCGRGAGTHGDVLNLHTEAFWTYTRRCFWTYTRRHHTHHTTQTERHRDRDRQTQTDTERDRERLRKRYETRQEKKREDNKREETRRW